ncbi:MAG: proline--tRNA ligase [Candidatus Omnitrophota bacterium]|nr:proline--tRNA ligase [Candidatus Omnitrophota bacterium]
MKWSESFIPTLKETPSDAEVISHKLMLRAGLIRKLASGVYSYLPLGLKILERVKGIIRQEMNSLGGQEVLLPALQPAELWENSGRDKEIGKVMIRFIDRHNKKMVLGPTHEEVITDLVKKDVKSYRQLPVVLYQIQTKFRDEPRPRFGVLRSCEFIMKDAYSFDRDVSGLSRNYSKMYDAYCRIFKRCGLKFAIKEADPGMMGGDVSHEFVVPAGGGREEIEIGHIFKLGVKYSKILNAAFLDEKGRARPIIMGCYGIGVNRIVAAAIEQSHDKQGIIWPMGISPYQTIVLLIDPSQGPSKKCASLVYSQLSQEKIDVLLDDRDERPGVKFKDADLIGIPLQLIVSERNLKLDQIELKLRRNNKVIKVKKEELIDKVKKIIRDEVPK